VQFQIVKSTEVIASNTHNNGGHHSLVSFRVPQAFNSSAKGLNKVLVGYI